MKPLFPLLLLVTIGSVCYGQGKDTTWGSGGFFSGIRYHNNSYVIINYDTVYAERFISDSAGNEYQIEYAFIYDPISAERVRHDSGAKHQHYIANCSIIQFHGNKQKTILSNYKAIYSPYECPVDNPDLWRKRLYQILNSKK